LRTEDVELLSVIDVPRLAILKVIGAVFAAVVLTGMYNSLPTFIYKGLLGALLVIGGLVWFFTSRMFLDNLAVISPFLQRPAFLRDQSDQFPVLTPAGGVNSFDPLYSLRSQGSHYEGHFSTKFVGSVYPDVAKVLLETPSCYSAVHNGARTRVLLGDAVEAYNQVAKKEAILTPADPAILGRTILHVSLKVKLAQSILQHACAPDGVRAGLWS